MDWGTGQRSSTSLHLDPLAECRELFGIHWVLTV
jgi:hypothetical protein